MRRLTVLMPFYTPFYAPLAAGAATVHIAYTGILNGEMRGLYLGMYAAELVAPDHRRSPSRRSSFSILSRRFLVSWAKKSMPPVHPWSADGTETPIFMVS